MFRHKYYPPFGWSAIIFILALGLLSLWMFVVEEPALMGGLLIILPLCAGLVVFAWRWFMHARLLVNKDGIHVLNPFSATQVSWEEVDRVTVADCLMIHKRDGDCVRAWAVEPANITRILGRTSYADRVAMELNQMLVESRSESWHEQVHLFQKSDSDRRKNQVAAAMVATWFLFSGAVSVYRETDRACDDLASLGEGYPDAPEPDRHIHPWASWRTLTDIDRALQPFLLDTVAHGAVQGYVRTHENFLDLESHAQGQHNPAARDLAVTHGFVREVWRQWTDLDGNQIRHVITQLSSPTNAESFNRHVARYSCRFAEELWPVPLDGEDPLGIGQRIHYRDGAVVEQVSWTRDGRRHLLALHDRSGHPRRELVEQLLARAYPRDDGSDVVPLPAYEKAAVAR